MRQRGDGTQRDAERDKLHLKGHKGIRWPAGIGEGCIRKGSPVGAVSGVWDSQTVGRIIEY